ncbi:Thioredoxin reductase-like selenoprotein T [Nymphon striatum]|nr:Thioredoxin reductase-like selenoprotein T [Nymphon striatum]
MVIAQMLSVGKLILIAMVVAGVDPFVSFGMVAPNFYTWMTQNKMYAGIMIFFVSNAIESQLLSTGAFEVSFNNMPVWSKLETGRLPSAPELFQIIDNSVRFKTAEDSFNM